MNNFQIILTGIFIVFIVAGVIIFGLIGPNKKAAPTVILWGTLPEKQLHDVLETINQVNEKVVQIQYVQKKPETFDAELIEALASDTGPDLFLLSSDATLSYKDKVFPIPFESFSERAFRDTFIEAGEIYVDNSTQTIAALPFLIDPLVLYWNRDLFSNVGVVNPPQTWQDFSTIVQKLTVINKNGTLQKAAAGIGEAQNVTHAKAILSALFIQSGVSITADKGSGMASTLSDRVPGEAVPAAEPALTFFTDFSNPQKKTYTWSRSFQPSRDLFIHNDLPMYFGFASEYQTIRRDNPNLNFDVTNFPQLANATRKSSFARLYGLAVLKRSNHSGPAFTAATLLVAKDFLASLVETTGLPPVRRDLLSIPATKAELAVFYAEALRSRTWLDPDPRETEKSFRTMVESVTSGVSTPSDALNRASLEIDDLILKHLKP